jgi:hypothetical protein
MRLLRAVSFTFTFIKYIFIFNTSNYVDVAVSSPECKAIS